MHTLLSDIRTVYTDIRCTVDAALPRKRCVLANVGCDAGSPMLTFTGTVRCLTMRSEPALRANIVLLTAIGQVCAFPSSVSSNVY